MSRAKECSHSDEHVGLRWRLFACLALFGALLLVSLWLFQVRLLAYFYQKEKFTEIKEIAGELESYLDADELNTLVEQQAKEHGVCIRVFAIQGKDAVPVADADITPDCVIHHLSPEVLSDLYKSAKDNGGSYDKRFEFDADGDENHDRFPGFPHRGKSINALHVRLAPGGDTWYLLMLDCELTPVDAVVKTLEVQFIWIAGVLLAAIFLLAFLLSRIVVKPLTVITQKASRLAAGEFEVDFSGSGYREVQELADALTYASKEIGATDRLQRELIANISHDLRTPLTMIKGYSEMMRDIPGENSPENIQAVIDETTRLSELVNDLMDLSKLQAGTLKPSYSVFDFTETVRDTLKRYDTLIRHKGYRIEVSLIDEVMVEADRTMILQVIYNLINNAINYTGESRSVRVCETLSEGRVRLSVSDDGEGIPPEQIGEIWDRYYRVDREHKRAVMGTGLGLSIVKSVLETHGAYYGVDSALGVGSVFWFELPIKTETAEEK